ncbi:MAG: hypothetical protein ACOX01_05490 [Methanobrevibacter boviskoreani]|uniref:hypothetical protein n=1 Tax=Methanobrevibacter boviskoreani TaxID=1348249 RepID=UPI003D93CCA9
MLYKKLIRDLSDHKLQFMAVFLMVFLAVFIYVGVGSEAYGFDQEVQSYYNETNMANVWLYGDNFKVIRWTRSIICPQSRVWSVSCP